MFDRHITVSRTDDPGLELPAATRDRLKSRFPLGAARRMTQLGMIVGALIEELAPTGEDALIYASSYGETRAIEEYLASFPDASPTLFQTSIHPSAVQQGAISRKRSLREFFPLAGAPAELIAPALSVAMTNPAPRVLLVGGEERGTWLRELGLASERTYAFALALDRAPASENASTVLGSLTLSPSSAEEPGALSFSQWFDLLHQRKPWTGEIGSGWRLELRWST